MDMFQEDWNNSNFWATGNESAPRSDGLLNGELVAVGSNLDYTALDFPSNGEPSNKKHTQIPSVKVRSPDRAGTTSHDANEPFFRGFPSLDPGSSWLSSTAASQQDSPVILDSDFATVHSQITLQKRAEVDPMDFQSPVNADVDSHVTASTSGTAGLKANATSVIHPGCTHHSSELSQTFWYSSPVMPGPEQTTPNNNTVISGLGGSSPDTSSSAMSSLQVEKHDFSSPGLLTGQPFIGHPFNANSDASIGQVQSQCSNGAWRYNQRRFTEPQLQLQNCQVALQESHAEVQQRRSEVIELRTRLQRVKVQFEQRDDKAKQAVAKQNFQLERIRAERDQLRNTVDSQAARSQAVVQHYYHQYANSLRQAHQTIHQKNNIIADQETTLRNYAARIQQLSTMYEQGAPQRLSTQEVVTRFSNSSNHTENAVSNFHNLAHTNGTFASNASQSDPLSNFIPVVCQQTHQGQEPSGPQSETSPSTSVPEVDGNGYFGLGAAISNFLSQPEMPAAVSSIESPANSSIDLTGDDDAAAIQPQDDQSTACQRQLLSSPSTANQTPLATCKDSSGSVAPSLNSKCALAPRAAPRWIQAPSSNYCTSQSIGRKRPQEPIQGIAPCPRPAKRVKTGASAKKAVEKPVQKAPREKSKRLTKRDKATMNQNSYEDYVLQRSQLKQPIDPREEFEDYQHGHSSQSARLIRQTSAMAAVAQTPTSAEEPIYLADEDDDEEARELAALLQAEMEALDEGA
ncbi:MAG: hypothetical protein Q9203_002517 [Teloschistes exilis]